MSLSSKITDEEMRFFQFRARQLYLLRKEDHEWNEFCKKNTCTCCSCQTHMVPKANKEIGVQSSPKRNIATLAKSSSTMVNSYSKNLPQALNEIKTKLEKIDLALSEINQPAKNEIKEMTKANEVFHQQLNTLTFPTGSDMAESVKSIINERRMQLIQDSLKMSLQRLQSAALRNTRANTNVKVKKKSSGYFIPRELERQRAAARRAYLASLEKTTIDSKVLPSSSRGKMDGKRNGLKHRSLKVTTESNLIKFNRSNNQKDEKPSLVETNQLEETKDEHIENAIDAILDDILGETVLMINKTKQSKSEKLPTVTPSVKHSPSKVSPMDTSKDSKEVEGAVIEHFQKKLENIRKNLHNARKETDPNLKTHGKLEAVEIKNSKNATKGEKLPSSTTRSIPHTQIRETQLTKYLCIDPVKAKQISKCRKDYWSYLERISRMKKGNFDPWALSNLVAESLLDDCIFEIAEEMQDVPASLLADLYDQEFLQSV